MSDLKKFIILPLAVVLILVLAVYFIFFKPYTAKPPMVLGQVLDFALVDANALPFGKKNLVDKVWVADFVFTSCAGVCPRMTAKMQTLARSYANEPGVHFVSISVDPDTDTPAKLAEYAKHFAANPEQWHFLTGPYAMIHALAVDSFKVGKVDEPIFHSEKFILVDQEARIRGYYDYDDAQAIKRLFHDIALVLREGQL